MSNTYFAFRRVDTFDRDKNRKDCFDVLDMDGVTPNYKLILASECPVDINQCLDEDGTLNDNVQILQTFGEDDGKIALLYSQGINGESTISVANTSVTYDLGDDKPTVKGIFLVSYANGSGYVLAYSINNVALQIPDDELILNTVGLIWGTKYVGGE